MKIASIDIGGTNFRTAMVDEKGRVAGREIRQIADGGILERIFSVLDGYRGFSGIGIGSLGPLDTNLGTINTFREIGMKRRIRIVELLQKRYGVKCTLLNDCVAGVYGELRFGAGKGLKNIVYLTLSTGIGCGVIENGRIVLGKDGNAHEMGHCAVDSEYQLRCDCGRLGRHWEAYSGGMRMPGFARLLAKKYGQPRLFRPGVSVKEIFEKAATDATARRIVSQIGRINASGVASIINAYDPELITIGGSIALKNRDSVLDPLIRHVGEYAINRIPKISITRLGEDIVLIGAAAYAMDAIRER